MNAQMQQLNLSHILSHGMSNISYSTHTMVHQPVQPVENDASMQHNFNHRVSSVQTQPSVPSKVNAVAAVAAAGAATANAATALEYPPFFIKINIIK